MREALAAADHDFVLTEPAPKLKRLRQKLVIARRRGSRRTGRWGGRYLSILATGFFVATAAAIVLNALVWQRTHHPAPLFARAAPVARAAPAAPAKGPMIAGLIAVPRPQPQPAGTPIQAHDKPVEKPPLEMSVGGHPRQTRINSPPPRDQISQLLQAAPARPTTKPAAPDAHSKSVLAAQRALVKLGFVLNPDGVAGAATRQAIERYERDRGLPVRGEVTAALLRQLRAETGSALN
ncbi:MAG: peptidoglycan-binding domain-containing protein [Methylocella sp.]